MVGFPVTDLSSAEQAARMLVDRGVDAAVVKLGAQGCYYAWSGGAAHVPAISVEAVDSVAAGDAFNGALAAALSSGEELARAVQIATAAGALSVTKMGAQDSMPLKAEVEQLLREHGLA